MTRENHPFFQRPREGPWVGGVRLLSHEEWFSRWCGREVSYLTFPLSLLSFRSGWSPGGYTTLISDTVFFYQDLVPDPHTTGNLILIFSQSVSCFSVFLKLQQISQELCRAYQAALHPPTICRLCGAGGGLPPPQEVLPASLASHQPVSH